MLVGYARVSTQEQDLALQLDALKGAGCEKVFEEKASGAQRERPMLKAALEYMREGDTLAVWKLDRLARSLKQLIETVEAFEERGLGLRSLTEAIDTTTAGGKLVFHIFAALAEFERGVIRERTMAGLQAARARGRKGGRPPALTAKDLATAMAMLKKMRDVWDNAPVNTAIVGQQVRIPGFVVPLEDTKDGMKEFLLVPYFGACIHSPPPPANDDSVACAPAAVAMPEKEPETRPRAVVPQLRAELERLVSDMAETMYAAIDILADKGKLTAIMAYHNITTFPRQAGAGAAGARGQQPAVQVERADDEHGEHAEGGDAGRGVGFGRRGRGLGGFLGCRRRLGRYGLFLCKPGRRTKHKHPQ